MQLRAFIAYLSHPSAIAFYQLIIVCLLGFQIQALLKIALTNPEGTAIILESLPHSKISVENKELLNG